MATLEENINQAISDFGDIKQAIINKGVTIEAGTPTSGYAAKIGEISGGIDESHYVDFLNNATEIYIPKQITDLNQYALGNKQITNVVFQNDIIFHKGFLSVTSYLEHLKSTKNIKASFYSADSSRGEGIFSNFTKLTDCGDIFFSNVLNHSFNGCTALTSINIRFDSDKTFELGSYIFQNCKALKTINILDNYSNFSFGTASNYTFQNCQSLKDTLFLLTSTAEDFKFGKNIFNGSGIQTLYLPEKTKNIDGTNGNGSFNNCSALEKVYWGRNELIWESEEGTSKDKEYLKEYLKGKEISYGSNGTFENAFANTPVINGAVTAS